MSRTILIIDDCADIARISARYLESAGYRTIVATSATEACKILGRTTRFRIAKRTRRPPGDKPEGPKWEGAFSARVRSLQLCRTRGALALIGMLAPRDAGDGN